MSTPRKLLYALVPVLVLALLFEGGARLVVDYVLPAVGSRGDQFREILTVQFNVSPQHADRLVRPDPDLFWALQPNTPDFVVNHPNALWLGPTTNARGLRDDPIVTPKPADTLRVLCVGDSCTYGSGVRRPDTVPDLLEARLGDLVARPVDVVNAGVPGYTAHQAVTWLERDGIALEPDVVVLTVGFNDRRSWGGKTDRQHAADERARRSGLAGLLRHSRGFQVLSQFVKESSGTRTVDRSKAARTSPRVPVEHFVAWLERARELAAGADAEIVYLLWPVASNLESAVNEKLTTHQVALRDFCAERGLPFVNPIPALRPHADEVYLFDDIHMTPRGNRIVAKELLSVVAPLLGRRRQDG